MKHVIWTNEINVKDWEDDIREMYPNIEDDEIYEVAYRENEMYFYDEKANMDKELGKPIVIIGNLGLWNGRRNGWKLTNKTNLNDIFTDTCGDYVTWYVEDGEIKCEDIHHDGTNYYTYRVVKDGISDWEFEEMMYDGKDIDELTDKLGKFACDIYGWEE